MVPIQLLKLTTLCLVKAYIILVFWFFFYQGGSQFHKDDNAEVINFIRSTDVTLAMVNQIWLFMFGKLALSNNMPKPMNPVCPLVRITN